LRTAWLIPAVSRPVLLAPARARALRETWSMRTNSLLHRFSLFTVLTLATSLAGCAADEGDVEEEEARIESAELSGSGIVVQTSIRGIKLDMTLAQVRGVAGAPKHVNLYLESNRVQWYDYGDMEVAFDRDTQRVKRVTNFSAAPRTKEGIGIGSTRKAVDALPNTACFASRETDFDGDSEYVFFLQRCEISTGTTAKTYFWFDTTPTPSISGSAKVGIVSLEKR
jgi:hypothetical protein